MERTENIPSPKEYRLWTAITTISAVMERKAWTSASGGAFYPNLYTILVGGPGAGKSTGVTVARKLWSKLKNFNIAPDSVSRASLMKDLSQAVRTVTLSDGRPRIFCSMAVACREFNTLFPTYDRDFCAAMNDLFDNPPEYNLSRIYSGSTAIQAPTLSMIAAVTPDTLGDTLPEPAWGSGFTARLILIYGSDKPDVDFFDEKDDEGEKEMYAALSPGLDRIFNLSGKFTWTDDAKNGLRAWRAEGLAPVPTHGRLQHYLTRRESHVVKLAMISGASSKFKLEVDITDFNRAKKWLIDAEKRMPDIFRAMGQKSDSQLIQDLHLEVYQIWATVARDKRKPVSNERVMEFLATRLPSERIEKVLFIAESIGALKRAGNGSDWIPRPIGTFETGNI